LENNYIKIMKHVNQLLPDYFTGTLSELETRTVKEHLAKCPICAADFEEVQNTFQLLKQRPLPEPDRAYFVNLLPMIRRRQERHGMVGRFFSGRTMRLVLPLSAAAVMMMFALLLPSRINSSRDASGLHALLRNMPNDELADVAVEQDKTALVAENHEFTSAIVDEHLAKDRLMKEALLADSETEPLSNTELEKTIDEFDNDQVDHLLVHLRERKSL